MTFDVGSHIINLKGKDYLETKWRIMWFHDDHPVPVGGIHTDLVNMQPPIVKATIYIEGQPVATGYAGAIAKANAVWAGREIEKAETAAIGRALAHAGYGMEVEDEDDFLADSPVERKPVTQQKPPEAPKTTPASAPSAATPPIEASAHKAAENAQNGDFDSIPSANAPTLDETDAWFAKLEPTWNTIKSNPLQNTYPQFWKIIADAKIYDNGNHMRNSVGKLQADGLITPAQTLRQAIMVVVSHRDVKYGNPPLDMTKDKVATDELPSREKLGLTG